VFTFFLVSYAKEDTHNMGGECRPMLLPTYYSRNHSRAIRLFVWFHYSRQRATANNSPLKGTVLLYLLSLPQTFG
jgi:hypothetical protein